MGTSANLKQGLPVWVVGAALAVLVLIVAFMSWRAVSPGHIDTRPARVIKPGEYDLRKEIAKMQEASKAKGPPADRTPSGGY